MSVGFLLKHCAQRRLRLGPAARARLELWVRPAFRRGSRAARLGRCRAAAGRFGLEPSGPLRRSKYKAVDLLAVFRRQHDNRRNVDVLEDGFDLRGAPAIVVRGHVEDRLQVLHDAGAACIGARSAPSPAAPIPSARESSPQAIRLWTTHRFSGRSRWHKRFRPRSRRKSARQ